ncbi:site-specific integrase [Curtobacterium sp. L3-7]|uniref:site-specific integrase n=1 Tax=Curtobacterium sp. L3-7 TaxID=3138787 RepID=UPI003B5302F3
MDGDRGTLGGAVTSFLREARDVRGLSEQTVRAYRGDLEDLLRFADARGIDSVGAVTLKVLREGMLLAESPPLLRVRRGGASSSSMSSRCVRIGSFACPHGQ